MNRQIRKWNALVSKFSRELRVILIITAPLLLVLLLRFIFTKLDGNKTMTSEISTPFGLGRLAGLSGLIAFLTSAILQVLKEQGDMRAEVHRASMTEWLERRFNFKHLKIVTTPIPKDLSDIAETQKSEEAQGSGDWADEAPGRIHSLAVLAEREIEELCAAGSSGQFFYNLPTEQFCGQIATAVDLVMIAPESHWHCFAALTSGAEKGHQAAVRAFVTLKPRESPHATTEETNQTEISIAGRNTIDADDFDRLRARVTNYAQRALDGLQLEATRRWKRQLIFASVQISLGISLAVVAIVAPPPDLSVSGVWMFAYSTMICGAAGALLAPVAYDITSAIRGLRHR